MDKQSLIQKLLEKKEVKDYTYAIFFLVVSSIFAIFAIRPALNIAFSLQKEEDNLRKVNSVYEQNLSQLVSLQANLQKVQDKEYLLDEALPLTPDTKTLIDDIKRNASEEGILLKRLSLSNIDLKTEQKKQDLSTIAVSMETTSDYVAVNNFLKKLVSQRRLKDVKNMKIVANEVAASGSASLKIVLEIEGYYF